MLNGFRRDQRVRVRKAFRSWYPGLDEGRVTEPTSLGIAVKVFFKTNRRIENNLWIDMNHLEKR
jgi:hypothetical protein